MKNQRKKELKELLLKMKEEKIAEIKQNTADKENIDSFQNEAGDTADTAMNLYEKDLHTGLMEKNKKLLTEIEEALAKIERGEYGKCERCGRDISIERLKVLPFAKLCIKCQSGKTK